MLILCGGASAWRPAPNNERNTQIMDTWTIYGARESKKKTGVNVTLVRGSGDKKEFAHVFVPYDAKKSSFAVDENGDHFTIKAKRLEAKRLEAEAVKDSDLPF